MFSCKGRTINDLGGGSGKSGKKKIQRLLAQEKKKLNANSLPEGPPRSLMVHPLLTTYPSRKLTRGVGQDIIPLTI